MWVGVVSENRWVLSLSGCGIDVRSLGYGGTLSGVSFGAARRVAPVERVVNRGETIRTVRFKLGVGRGKCGVCMTKTDKVKEADCACGLVRGGFGSGSGLGS